MSLWPRDSCSIFIGSQCLRVVGSAGEPGNLPWVLNGDLNEAEKSKSLSAALATLLETVNRSGRAEISRLVVTDRHARHWMMKAPEGVGSLSELQAVAQARCHQLFGTVQRWRIAADWHARRAFLCAAIPEWIHDASVTTLGNAHSMHTALSLFLSDSFQKFPREGWICITDSESTNLLSLRHGRLQSVRTMPANPDVEAPERLRVAARELRRESLRTGTDLAAGIQWWDREPGAHAAVDEGIDVDGTRFRRVAAFHPELGLAGHSSDI